jgi:hypothetical protein
MKITNVLRVTLFEVFLEVHANLNTFSVIATKQAHIHQAEFYITHNLIQSC